MDSVVFSISAESQNSLFPNSCVREGSISTNSITFLAYAGFLQSWIKEVAAYFVWTQGLCGGGGGGGRNRGPWSMACVERSFGFPARPNLVAYKSLTIACSKVIILSRFSRNRTHYGTKHLCRRQASSRIVEHRASQSIMDGGCFRFQQIFIMKDSRILGPIAWST